MKQKVASKLPRKEKKMTKVLCCIIGLDRKILACLLSGQQEEEKENQISIESRMSMRASLTGWSGC